MPALDTLTASQILAIAPTEPERLFSGDRVSLRHEFAVLAKHWHPDCNRSNDASRVMARVMALYEAATHKLATNEWCDPGVLRIDTVSGRSFVLKVRQCHDFELGRMAIAVHRVAFLIEKEHTILFETGLRRIAEIRYPDDQVRRDIAKFMPQVLNVYETAQHHVAIIAKPADTVLLKDLITYMGGQLPPRQAVWIVSRLLNLACFFEVTGLTHNAISTDTVFLSARNHGAYLLGGWWYSAPAGHPIELLPEATYDLLPLSMATNKRADIRLDLEAIRAVGRTLLGDPTGLDLARRGDVPKPLATFLRLPAPRSAIKDYRAWQRVLEDSFGPPRFIELPVSFNDVYPDVQP